MKRSQSTLQNPLDLDIDRPRDPVSMARDKERKQIEIIAAEVCSWEEAQREEGELDLIKKQILAKLHKRNPKQWAPVYLITIF